VANNIKVSLMKGTNGAEDWLYVEQRQTDHVLCRKGDQDIHWQLVEQQGQSLAWEPLGTSRPGFVWISTPPVNYFDEPTIGNNGKHLILRAHHLTASSVGCWIYMLRVRDVGANKVYSTTVSQTTATDPNPQGHCGDSPSGPGPIVATGARASDNPIIINR
jgi:hypothetical protein